MTELRRDLRFPSVDGAIEVMARLGVTIAAADLACQDWDRTFPDPDHLPAFLALLAAGDLSDMGKRVLGAFLFQALEDWWVDDPDSANAAVEAATVRTALAVMWRERDIHGYEFLYWGLHDEPDMLDADPAHWWAVTRLLRIDGPFDLSTLRDPAA